MIKPIKLMDPDMTGEIQNQIQTTRRDKEVRLHRLGTNLEAGETTGADLQTDGKTLVARTGDVITLVMIEMVARTGDVLTLVMIETVIILTLVDVILALAEAETIDLRRRGEIDHGHQWTVITVMKSEAENPGMNPRSPAMTTVLTMTTENIKDKKDMIPAALEVL